MVKFDKVASADPDRIAEAYEKVRPYLRAVPVKYDPDLGYVPSPYLLQELYGVNLEKEKALARFMEPSGGRIVHGLECSKQIV